MTTEPTTPTGIGSSEPRKPGKQVYLDAHERVLIEALLRNHISFCDERLRECDDYPNTGAKSSHHFWKSTKRITEATLKKVRDD